MALPKTTIFVKMNGVGDGSSWGNATGDLQMALKSAKYGMDIWVAKGIYYPTNDNDRSKSFIIPNGVKLIGGFEGHEKERRLQKPKINKTILSGEIGGASNKDNSNTIIYTKNVTAETEIDGFYIIGGCADDWKEDRSGLSRSGGGWYNEGTGNSSNPVIKNCVFENNEAVDGGAFYNNASKGNNTVSIINCQFIGNLGYTDGGAIYNDCHFKGYAGLIIEECFFKNNKSNNGACIFNYSFNGKGEGKILNSKFLSNKAVAKGGVLYNGAIKERTFFINNCVFLDNTAQVGNKFFEINNYENSKETLFLNNRTK